MACIIFSKFYGGFNVDESSFYLPFKEGAGPELNAQVAVGSYSVSDFCAAIKSALNSAGSFSYTVTMNRTTRILTITSSGSFTILGSTGTTVGQSILPKIGFLIDTSSSTSHIGTVAVGYEYRPQFPLQDYTPSKNNSKAVEASINKSASGIIQVVKFGVEKFIKFSIQYVNNEPSSSNIIRYNPNAITELNSFLDDSISKNYIEFMYDENDVNNFEVIILESTSYDQKGVGYELKEMTNKKLYGHWETGLLTYRKIGA